MPRYIHSPPGHRFKVLLVDSKNSKNDLHFCPIQSFESDAIAKDYAALLALFQLQNNIPLERKLPEPYRTTWLQMISSPSKTSSTSTKTALIAEVDSKPINQTLQQSTVEKISLNQTIKQSTEEKILTVESLDPEVADWLCDSCGNQNYAKLASGLPRLKCFKCQTLKSNKAVLVSSTSVVTSQNDKVKIVKAPPVAVLDLK